ncbi:activating signal cointegrator 1 [Macrobrachium rosenbergii]|uniref:activating signal cointegrator 1 n=1 Tax=Macrobrachium rosenbergii TaxID=79674 RepID=UPI0034D58451
MGSLEKWACSEMEKLGIPEPSAIVRYLQPIENPVEVEEYLISMLDTGNPSHRHFIEEFLRKQEEIKTAVDTRFYRKPDLEVSPVFKVGDKKKQRGAKENGFNKGPERMQPPTQTNGSLPTPPQPSGGSSGKKKTKYVSLYSNEGKNKDVVLLSGRHKCDCQASKHKLINNCLKCGRVICEQEGSGPCSFCGNLVTTNEEEELLEQNNRKSEALQRRLFSEKNAFVKGIPSEPGKDQEGLRKAVEHKNKLLEFDRTSEKRTKVYDDESDYFSTGSRWLSQEQKAKLEKREEELRKKKYDRSNQKVTIDLLGRRIIPEENDDCIYDPDDPIIKEILEVRSNDIFSAPDREESKPYIEVDRPEYVEGDMANHRRRIGNMKFAGMSMRIQDREIQEMVDEGMCLSMHQPWASLLVAGIKVHEGRAWYSSHRGRLWIASAAKPPTPQEISQLEQTYRVLLKDENIKFPQYYPAGCLLGCVDVVDVLPQEEYRGKYPEGESDSPYVFVCENPQEMVLKFPMKGQHKIYKMDPKIHQAAKKALRPKGD